MRFFIPLFVVALLVLSCFLPWMTIEGRNITISGVETAGTTYGKPAYFHFFWMVIYILFILANKVWSRRAAMVAASFNAAWALRNFLLIPACQMGECPDRKLGLYLLLISAVALIFAGALAPLMKRRRQQRKR